MRRGARILEHYVLDRQILQFVLILSMSRSSELSRESVRNAGFGWFWPEVFPLHCTTLLAKRFTSELSDESRCRTDRTSRSKLSDTHWVPQTLIDLRIFRFIWVRIAFSFWATFSSILANLRERQPGCWRARVTSAR